MNDLQIFRSEDFGNIRTTIVNNEPWFVGKDVADILGYQNGSRDINRHVDEDDRRKVMIFDGNQDKETIVINESGLYSLILSSKMPNAKKFKHWVTNDILPTIRRHGAYMSEKTLEQALTSPDFLIQLATQLKDEQNARRKLEAQIEQDAPKVLFAKAVETAHNSILIGDLAKLLRQNGVDTGQKRLFELLRKEGYLIKNGSSYNMPTQRAMDMGLFEVKESTINNPDGSVRISRTTKVTGKGQTYFINKFLAV